MTIPENPFALSHSSGRNANTQNEEIMSKIKGGKDIIEEQQKHEEIKRMAFKIYTKMQLLDDELFFKRMREDEQEINFKDFNGEKLTPILKIAWERAENFYEYAKEKEGEK